MSIEKPKLLLLVLHKIKQCIFMEKKERSYYGAAEHF